MSLSKARRGYLFARILFILSLGAAADYAAAVQDANDEAVGASDETVPFSTLLEKSVAITSQASVFNWRRSPALLSLGLGQAVEMNNFDNDNLGLRLRIPSGDWLWSVLVRKTWVTETEGSAVVAKTPYLQGGRPSRVDLGFGADLPVAEGVGNQRFTWLPRTQFVLSLVSELELAFYQGMGGHGGPKEKLWSIISPDLGDEDYAAVQKQAPGGMRVSRARLNAALGFNIDLMHRSGVIFGLRSLWHQVLSADKGMGPWRSLSFEVGYGF